MSAQPAPIPPDPEPRDDDRPVPARAPGPICLIPPELAPRIHEQLRHHLTEAHGVEVVVDRRRGERRAAERRSPDQAAEGLFVERRRIRNPRGCRVAERRARQVPAEPPPLPRWARRHANRISFVQRLAPLPHEREDEDSTRLAICFQAGDEDAFSALYARYRPRVHSFLDSALSSEEDVEEVTQEVFTRVLEELPRFDARQPFSSWLLTIARRHAITDFERQQDLDLEEAERRALKRRVSTLQKERRIRRRRVALLALLIAALVATGVLLASRASAGAAASVPGVDGAASAEAAAAAAPAGGLFRRPVGVEVVDRHQG